MDFLFFVLCAQDLGALAGRSQAHAGGVEIAHRIDVSRRQIDQIGLIAQRYRRPFAGIGGRRLGRRVWLGIRLRQIRLFAARRIHAHRRLDILPLRVDVLGPTNLELRGRDFEMRLERLELRLGGVELGFGRGG